jgi:hypothetical protein
MEQNVPDDKIPLENLVSGMRVHALEEGEFAVSAFLLLKVRDSEGEMSWSYRTTEPPNREELLGALLVQADLLRKELLDDWSEES